MVLVAPRSAKLVEARGARFTLMSATCSACSASLTMLLLWKEGAPTGRWVRHAFIGIGVGLAGTPVIAFAHRSPRPCAALGMASGTADLQRDLGGATDTRQLV